FVGLAPRNGLSGGYPALDPNGVFDCTVLFAVGAANHQSHVDQVSDEPAAKSNIRELWRITGGCEPTSLRRIFHQRFDSAHASQQQAGGAQRSKARRPARMFTLTFYWRGPSIT